MGGCFLVFLLSVVIYLQVVLYEHFSSAGVMGALVRVAGVDVGVLLAIVVAAYVIRFARVPLTKPELADASDYGSDVAGRGFEETVDVLTAARRSLEPTLLKHLGHTRLRIIGERLDLITVYDTRRYLQTSRASRTDFTYTDVPFQGHSTACTFGVRWTVEVGGWWSWEPWSSEILLVVDSAGEAVLQCPPSKRSYPATAAGWRALVAAYRL
ncbi:hypothetical protein OG205_46150 [Lentzea sp. NBC_00516]|uniref:hypothetical protein n=1 Tax=Lentzea sp. NBC_00516 TaxID=2903582 RepID=UPI002E8086EA|nr:hypothetical protein [Lentzea sp. NBC_00516]WUD25312.1 hypothetical protein OG205_46150 [Lentzea sp. NBC_00516]